MAKNVSSGQGLFDDLNFARSPSASESTEESRKPSGQRPGNTVSEEWKGKMTVKKSVYLTRRNLEALALRHAGMAKTDRDFSKTVNEALESYLSDEIAALDEADSEHMHDDVARYSRALTQLMARRLEQ